LPKFAESSIVTGDVTYLEPSSLSENFIYLSFNATKTVNFQVQRSGSDFSVLAYLDDNSTVTSSLTSDTATVTLHSSQLPALGTYLLRTEVQPCKGSGRNKDLIVYHEEAITGLDVSFEHIVFSHIYKRKS
jgi:hypothetical protein